MGRRFAARSTIDWRRSSNVRSCHRAFDERERERDDSFPPFVRVRRPRRRDRSRGIDVREPDEPAPSAATSADDDSGSQSSRSSAGRRPGHPRDGWRVFRRAPSRAWPSVTLAFFGSARAGISDDTGRFAVPVSPAVIDLVVLGCVVVRCCRSYSTGWAWAPRPPRRSPRCSSTRRESCFI